MGDVSARHKAPPKGGEITLVNPVADHYEAFVIGNAAVWERLAMADLQAVAPDAIDDLNAIEDWLPHYEPKGNTLISLAAAARLLMKRHGSDPYTATEGSAKGQHIVIAGAGPSLRETAPEWCAKADQVWGCNSALTWLLDHGHRVTHGFTIDQTPHMLTEWQSAPDVEYLLATTCHPHLVELLEQRGRRIRFVHNYVGMKQRAVDVGDGQQMAYEDWLYGLLFPATIRAGSGLNSVTRAIDVAQFMGAAEITVLGADCALRVTAPRPKDVGPGAPEYDAWLRESVEMHADGGHALTSGATAVTLAAEIDGREWVTKPDMAITAQWLVAMAKKIPGVRLVGDTLPNAIFEKPQAFMDRLPHLTDSRGKPIRYAA